MYIGLVIDAQFDRASRSAQQVVKVLFPGQGNVQCCVMANALKIHEEILKVKHRYLQDMKTLSMFYSLQDDGDGPETPILGRLELLENMFWSKLRSFNFRTAFPVLVSCHLILQYSLLMSLLLESEDLANTVIEYIVTFDLMFRSALRDFKPIRSEIKKTKDVDIL